MVKDTGIYGIGIKMIQIGGFKTRLIGYFIFFIPVFFISISLYIATDSFGGLLDFTNFLPRNNFGRTIALLITFLTPALPFYFWEKSIRKFRRKNGLDIYKDISAELGQREINERVAKEHKAFVNNGIVKESLSVDKSDIGYWFGLFEKGAISKEEYEGKKAELM